MRVVTASGESVELGITETTPTIGITDYSRRVTDDFGVTTVVPRSFSRRLSVKLALPFGNVDGLQQRVAALRATSALWIADERFSWLRVQGYYKDFSLDLAVAPVSLCTLTVEGLTEGGDFSDPGGDPAPDKRASSLRLLQPVAVSDTVLANSTVAENDHPAWSASQTYAAGARVIKTGTHRIYESTRAGNIGNDPAGASGAWLDLAPTKRWAMFDQALGTATTAAGSIAVTLNAGAVSGVALLDVVASSVRVQAPGYDRTLPAGAGAITFLDLPDVTGPVTVTIAGRGTVSVGTLLIGRVVGLGITETSPTAGITDYSRKVTDDFGEVTVVERAWAKRMTTAAVLRTDALDLVASRIASVRATPSLWIGQSGADSLTIYGFFKEFSIEVGDTISKLSLSVEGLSQAAPIAPGGLGEPTAWPDVTDPTGTKPTDNADKTSENTSKDTNAVGGVPASQVLARQDAIETVTIPSINAAVAQANERIIAAQDNAYAAVAAANDRIAAAQGKLDQAVLDLATEIDRARGADEDLTRRVDAIMAGGSGPGEADITALIERIDLVRADGERSLASAIQNVVTAYQDLDTATNTRITQSVAALSDADRSIGQRIDSVEVDYRGLNTNTNVRITDSVKALADADQAIGERINELIANGGGSSEGVDTVARSEIRRVETATALADAALGRRVDTVQSSFTKTAVMPATMKAAIQWTSAEQSETPIPFASDDPRFVVNGEGISVFATGLGENVLLAPVASFKPTAGRRYRLVWKVRKWSPATDGSLVVQAGFCLRLINGAIVYVGADFAQDVLSSSSSDYTNVAFEWVAPEGLAWARPRLHINYSNTNGSVMVAGLGLDDLTEITAANALIAQTAVTASDAAKAVADLTTSVGTQFQGVNLTLGGYDQLITALSTDQQGYVGRTSTLEAQMRREQPSALNAFTDDVNNRLTQVNTAVNARIKTSEDVIADLPNRYAAASRTELLEAQFRREAASPINDAIDYVSDKVDTSAVQLSARIEERATAIADAKAGAVAQTVQQLQAQYNGDVALIRETSGAIAGINQRTSVYWEVVGTTNDGSTMVRLSKQDGSRGVFYIGADLLVDGNAIFNGTVTTTKIAPNNVTNSVVIAGLSGFGISAASDSETPAVSIGSTGGTMKIDVQADGVRSSGSGVMKVQLWASYNGNTLPLSRLVAFSPSNMAQPVSFFAVSSFPAGVTVQFFLRFSADNSTWSYNSGTIAVTEFKR
jgi:chitodextrinase